MKTYFLNGLALVLPVLLVRFLLLSFLSKQALKRASYFPPVRGIEKSAYLVNVITTFLLFIIPFFLRINTKGLLSITGLFLFILGLILYIVSIIQFSKPGDNGVNASGLYGISRNPMYVAFFIYFSGCCLLTRSWLLLIVLLVFQFSVHFLIISEERWCKDQFGESYFEYIKKVRRYIQKVPGIKLHETENINRRSAIS